MNWLIQYFCIDKKFLTINLVKVSLKLRYRDSSLGYVWSFLVPLFTAMTYFFVFKVVMRLQVPNYDIFIITGVLPWTFFASVTLEGMDSVMSNFSLMSKVPIRFNIFPYSMALTHLINLLLSYVIIIIFVFIKDLPITKYYLLLPFLIFLLFSISYSLGVIFSVLFVYFRDLRHLLGVIVPVWMYATPILYPFSMVPDNLKKFMAFNPVSGFFISSYHIILKGEAPPAFYLIAICLWTLALLCISNLLIAKFKNRLVEDL